jgi:hypothetical protein
VTIAPSPRRFVPACVTSIPSQGAVIFGNEVEAGKHRRAHQDGRGALDGGVGLRAQGGQGSAGAGQSPKGQHDDRDARRIRARSSAAGAIGQHALGCGDGVAAHAIGREQPLSLLPRQRAQLGSARMHVSGRRADGGLEGVEIVGCEAPRARAVHLLGRADLALVTAGVSLASTSPTGRANRS